jgi:hypothetical protein
MSRNSLRCPSTGLACTNLCMPAHNTHMNNIKIR